MSLVERVDRVIGTQTGQAVGWTLILALLVGFFGQMGSEGSFPITVLALGLSWILGVSYGRHQARNDVDRDREPDVS